MKQKILHQYNVSILLIPMSIYLLGYFAPISSKMHDNIFYILVLLPFIFWVKKRDFLDLLHSRVVLLTVIFTGYLVLHSLFYSAADFSEAIKPFRYLISFWVFFSVIVSLFQRKIFKQKINYIVLWATVWGAINTVIYYSQHGFPGRLQYNGPVEHAVIGACIYATLFLFALFGHNIKSRLLIVFSSTIIFLLVLFSQSRGPLLALIVAGLVGSVCKWRKLGVVVPVIFGTAFIVANQKGLITFSRLSNITSSYRFEIWHEVISSSWKKGDWLFGQSLLADHTVTVGKMTFDHAHSGYVATFFQGGLVGFLFLLTLIVVAGWCVIKEWRQSRSYLGVVLYVFATLIILTDSHNMLNGPGPLWFYFWLPLAYIAAQEINFIKAQVGDDILVQPE